MVYRTRLKPKLFKTAEGTYVAFTKSEDVFCSGRACKTRYGALASFRFEWRARAILRRFFRALPSR